MTEHTWTAGQQVVLFGSWIGHRVTTVDRVTPSGRAIIGDTTFNRNGYERSGRYSRQHIEPATPELLARLTAEASLKERATGLRDRWDAATRSGESALHRVLRGDGEDLPLDAIEAACAIIEAALAAAREPGA